MIRIADYDRLAEGFDRRYALYRYEGIQRTLRDFIGADRPAALEVGCGTGHWLASVADEVASLVGLDPSSEMLARASRAAPAAKLVRGCAEALPYRDRTFDRIFCVNALHHFADRTRFFSEAHRVLKRGGGLLTIGKDPHAELDAWWVYDYFPGTRDIDRRRFARVRTLRGELAHAGFTWAESFEAEHVDVLIPAAEAFQSGIIDPAHSSQLALLTEDEMRQGVERLRAADREADGGLQLVADFRLFATVGWLA